jgi:hypothetical protein
MTQLRCFEPHIHARPANRLPHLLNDDGAAGRGQAYFELVRFARDPLARPQSTEESRVPLGRLQEVPDILT